MNKIAIVCALGFIAGFAQDQAYKPGITYQATNPNYPVRNPFYFEGRVDWDLRPARPRRTRQKPQE